MIQRDKSHHGGHRSLWAQCRRVGLVQRAGDGGQEEVVFPGQSWKWKSTLEEKLEDGAVRSTSRSDGGGGADGSDGGGLSGGGSMRRKCGEGVPREDGASRKRLKPRRRSRSRGLGRNRDWLAMAVSGTRSGQKPRQWRCGRGDRQRQRMQTRQLSPGAGLEGGKRQASAPGVRSFAVFGLKTRETRTRINADEKERRERERPTVLAGGRGPRYKGGWMGLHTAGGTPSLPSGNTEMGRLSLCSQNAYDLGKGALQSGSKLGGGAWRLEQEFARPGSSGEGTPGKRAA